MSYDLDTPLLPELISEGETVIYNAGPCGEELGTVHAKYDNSLKILTSFVKVKSQSLVKKDDIPPLSIGQDHPLMVSKLEEVLRIKNPIAVIIPFKHVTDIATTIHADDYDQYDAAGMKNAFFYRFEVDWCAESPTLLPADVIPPFHDWWYSSRVYYGIGAIKNCIRKMTAKAGQSSLTCHSDTLDNMSEAFRYLWFRLWASSREVSKSKTTRIQRNPDLSQKRVRVEGISYHIRCETLEALEQVWAVMGAGLGMNARLLPRELHPVKENKLRKVKYDDWFNVVVPEYESATERTQALRGDGRLRPSSFTHKKNDCIELVYFAKEHKLSVRVSYTVVDGHHPRVRPFLELRPETHGNRICISQPFVTPKGVFVKVVEVGEDGWVYCEPLNSKKKSTDDVIRFRNEQACSLIEKFQSRK